MSDANKKYDIWGKEISGEETGTSNVESQLSGSSFTEHRTASADTGSASYESGRNYATENTTEHADAAVAENTSTNATINSGSERQIPYGMGGRQENFYRFSSGIDNNVNGPDGNPPEPVKKKSRKGLIAGIICTVLFLGLIGTGVYLVVDYVNDRFAAYEEELRETEEETREYQNGLTMAEGTIDATDTSTSGATILDVSGVVDKVMPSVVSLAVNLEYQTNNMFFGTSTQSSSASGSGVIIGESEEELLIVTNNHVVAEDEQTYYYTVNTTALVVTFCDGSTAEAYVKGTDVEKDLAVIAIPMEDLSQATKDAIKVAAIGNSDVAKVGNGVIAIGNALGYGQSCTVGYISALNRDITFSDGTTRTLMQVDAAINPGNSGGGLFDVYGNLIGINESKNVSENAEGIGYAIPISSVEDIITELMNTVPRIPYDEDEKGYLGIQGSDVPSAYVSAGYPSGAIVLQIFEGGAAEQSDLQLQDIITKINDVEISSMTALMEELSYYKSGETVVLQVQRIAGNKFQAIEVEVTLGTSSTLPDDSNNNSQGNQNSQNGNNSGNGINSLLP